MGHFNFVPNTEIKILRNVYTVIECTNESLNLLHVFVKLSRLFNVIFDYLIVTHITCTCIYILVMEGNFCTNGFILNEVLSKRPGIIEYQVTKETNSWVFFFNKIL